MPYVCMAGLEHFGERWAEKNASANSLTPYELLNT